VYAISDAPEAGGSGLRAATLADLDRLVPACAAAHELELGIDPVARDSETFRFRTEAQIDEGRSWLWLEDDVVLFKAEASAWTPAAVQIQQVWVDPEARGRGYATRGMRDLCRLLLEKTPIVTLFVRSENAPAIALYERIGMTKALEYRTVLL
jgi:predicted GNAT family acetyltransferase